MADGSGRAGNGIDLGGCHDTAMNGSVEQRRKADRIAAAQPSPAQQAVDGGGSSTQPNGRLGAMHAWPSWTARSEPPRAKQARPSSRKHVANTIKHGSNAGRLRR